MTPKHHLDDTTLLSHSAGSLPPALAVVCATHLACCSQCRDRLLQIDQIGGVLMEQQLGSALPAGARAAMLARLDASAECDESSSEPPVFEPDQPEQDPDRLPAPLHPWFGSSMRRLRWRWVAPGLHRIRAQGIDGGDLMLLRVAPGSRLPLHSHQCNELTVVLDGAYSDMLGHFGPGDAADLDEDTLHQPVAATGVPCICVAATDAPLRFPGWIARTLQPLFGF